MIFTLILLFLTIAFGQLIASFVLKKDNYPFLNIYSLAIIIMIFIINGALTYKPINNFFFWDVKNKTYNIVYK